MCFEFNMGVPLCAGEDLNVTRSVPRLDSLFVLRTPKNAQSGFKSLPRMLPAFALRSLTPFTVRRRGFEPPSRKAYAPQAYVYTNSTTCALFCCRAIMPERPKNTNKKNALPGGFNTEFIRPSELLKPVLLPRQFVPGLILFPWRCGHFAFLA